MSPLTSGTTFRCRTLASQALDLPISVDLVVFENSQLGLLPLVFDLLGGSVHLLLPLLGTTTKTEDEMESRLFLNVVVGKSAAIFELLAGEDQALLVWRDAFLVFEGSESCRVGRGEMN